MDDDGSGPADKDPPGIRTATGALIIENEETLLVQYRNNGEEWYTPPGGGQQFGETLHEPLQRESRAELGVELRIGSLVAVRHYIADNNDIEGETKTHQLELMFHCSLPDDIQPGEGCRPDENQVAVEWVGFNSLREIYFFPEKLKPLIPEFSHETGAGSGLFR
ncbi:MAG: ADP-ribose pyrophosphatase [halophilic archaeon J07HX5]|nr:MAG: ADP-ribose pyrophosphatase [halophilic archaeon J07HX5]